jgi:hypothetical protein
LVVQLRFGCLSGGLERLERLGRVAAPEEAAAETAAVAEFGLKDHERKRLLVEEVS